MKRKMKKFNEGGETKYNREDEGLFGGKINYREDDEGRKFVAGKANPMDRNPSEQRYYSKDDVKKGLSDVGDKISNFFGGKKESSSSKFDELESVGGASRRPRTIQEQISGKSEEAPVRKIEHYIKKSDEAPAKPAGKTYVNQEYKEEPEKKKAAPAVKKAKASQDSGFPKDTKSTRMPSGHAAIYDKLDVREKKPPTNSRFKGRSENPIQGTIDSATKGLDRRTNEQKMADRVRFVAEGRKKEKADELGYGIKKGGMVKKMASGGSVKSASARADGCAIRGKTRA